MPKYFYIDKNTGKLKKYVGKVEERDGKLFGILVSHKTERSIAKLEQVESGKEIVNEITSLAWKDNNGIEHDLTDSDDFKNGKVTCKIEHNIDLIWHPEIKAETYFIDANGNRFYGEPIMKDGKFFRKA